jgi:hypothetical protein
VAWCPFLLFRPLGLVISYVVINTDLLFISLFVALCVKLDPGTHKGNAVSFSLKTGCDRLVCPQRSDKSDKTSFSQPKWSRLVRMNPDMSGSFRGKLGTIVRDNPNFEFGLYINLYLNIYIYMYIVN